MFEFIDFLHFDQYICNLSGCPYSKVIFVLPAKDFASASKPGITLLNLNITNFKLFKEH